MKRFLRKRRGDGATDTWSIETMGRTSVVKENGKTSSRLHDGGMQCDEEAEREIDARLEDGWFEVAEYAPEQEELDRRDFLRARWAPLTGAPPDVTRLRQWFSFLCETDECHDVLAHILDHVREVRIGEHAVLEVSFAKPAGTLRCRGPAKIGPGLGPEATRRVVEHHRSLSYQTPKDPYPAPLLEVDSADFLDDETLPANTRLLCADRDKHYAQNLSGPIAWNERDPDYDALDEDPASTEGALTGLPYGLTGFFLRSLLEAIERDLR